jgi:uncharacterized protein (DUF1778 family)
MWKIRFERLQMKITEKTRFDTRLTKEQKEFFEYAATIGGYRSLTEFVLVSVDERAKKIVEEHNRIISSKRDQEIFFHAISETPRPNETLENALTRYNDLVKSE